MGWDWGGVGTQQVLGFGCLPETKTEDTTTVGIKLNGAVSKL